ncbi:MAG: hypothetical protein RMI94_11905 [Bryobacterales bacterium]|nr:FecR domain-containing protein [Bryobacteraceae bacterium]MDW8131248.1 hypothetical protein [Bryobacterales bacterium]
MELRGAAMKVLRGVCWLTGMAGIAVFVLRAQELISAKAGLVHYVEGRVLLDGRQVQIKPGEFPQIPVGGVLASERGRAEVLLAPGVFVRIAESSAVRLLTDDLSDTRLELLEGSMLVECAETLKGNRLAIALGKATVTIRSDGLYRLDSRSPELRVYDGQAVVETGGQLLKVKKGRAVALDGSALSRKFDVKQGDAFLRWSRRRAEIVAMANLSAAKTMYEERVRLRRSTWVLLPDFGMLTFVPYGGIWVSPFGYPFYSPGAVSAVFEPPRRSLWSWDPTPRHDANLGYGTIGATPAGTSGTVAASGPPTAASEASHAPIPRETGSAGGRPR